MTLLFLNLEYAWLEPNWLEYSIRLLYHAWIRAYRMHPVPSNASRASCVSCTSRVCRVSRVSLRYPVYPEHSMYTTYPMHSTHPVYGPCGPCNHSKDSRASQTGDEFEVNQLQITKSASSRCLHTYRQSSSKVGPKRNISGTVAFSAHRHTEKDLRL